MTRRNRVVTSFIAACAIAALSATAGAQDRKVDVTGKWIFTVQSEAGTGTPTVTMKQSGDTLTGHYSSQTLGEVDFKGTVKEQKISFTFTATIQGTALAVTYLGTIDGDAIKGTVDFGGMGGGTFTAKRQP